MDEQQIQEVFKNKDAGFLCKYFFNANLTDGQKEIVQTIAFQTHRRVCINAMTRYGKSQSVAWGVSLLILLNPDLKIALIGPTRDQTAIIRNYVAEIIVASPIFEGLLETSKGSDVSRLRKEASRKRYTFANGCELRILSAHGEAEGLMGFGADVVVIDEACLISNEAYAKILRMLGDNAEKSVLIELANPWDSATRYYEHYISPRFKTIHIGWERALGEGRITQEFVDEMRHELTPIEFTVLYDSQFPEQAIDSLFKLADVTRAQEQNFDDGEIRIISCDPADKGLDHTVIMYGTVSKDDQFTLIDIYHEPISDNMKIAGRIIDWANEKRVHRINIDCIGVGIGVLSRVKEVLGGSGIRITACHYGEAPATVNNILNSPTLTKKRFINKKAENYFRLRTLFEESKIQIPRHHKLVKELLAMKWELTSSGKIKIIDPDKSPDYADALVYMVWKTQTVSFFFG